MELLQSSLVKYWQFEPMTASDRAEQEKRIKDAIENGDASAVEAIELRHRADASETAIKVGAALADDLFSARTVEQDSTISATNHMDDEKTQEDDEPRPGPKKVPVFLFDEAHKLPS